MSEIEFKMYNEEEIELLEVSNKIKSLNKEFIELRELIESLDTINKEHSPLINEIEEDICNIKKTVKIAQENLEKAEKYQTTNRRYTALISGGLGSLAGGTIGMLLIPLIGPTTPLITSLVGGVTGIVYSVSK